MDEGNKGKKKDGTHLKRQSSHRILSSLQNSNDLVVTTGSSYKSLRIQNLNESCETRNKVYRKRKKEKKNGRKNNKRKRNRRKRAVYCHHFSIVYLVHEQFSGVCPQIQIGLQRKGLHPGGVHSLL